MNPGPLHAYSNNNNNTPSFLFLLVNTGCGRKNSPIWEENKNQTKQDNFLNLE
jgi:hypothetical protein